MKLAASCAAARQERMERIRRGRLSAQALRVAFPGLERIRLELKFEGAKANPPADQSHVLHPAARAFFEFPCPYADCDGEFDLTSAVAKAVAGKAHEAHGVLDCCGRRALDYASKQECRLQVLYTVTATY